MSDNAMIEEVRKYFLQCPYLSEYAKLNVEYLSNKTETYSINESVGYNPILHKFLIGSEMQFLFSFDSRLVWNEDVMNNIDNSRFFEKVRDWLQINKKKKIFPNIKGIYNIEATTNGYVFETNMSEAIYRIQCKIEYFKED